MANKPGDNNTKNDIHLMILQDLLKLEDNKYCVDCDAKGPRWASTNLGVFLCIRCAGIHRKLGVHISRVKSVTLDSWTAEQIATMKTVGNKRGREIYEADVSESFCRPQSTNTLEAFIRSKYEMRRYYARNYVEETPDVDAIHSLVAQIQSQMKRNHKGSVNSGKIELSLFKGPPTNAPTPLKEPTKSTARPENAKKSTENDLENIFGDFSVPSQVDNKVPETKPVAKNSSSDLDGLDFGFNTPPALNKKQDSIEKTKESILALFNTAPQSGAQNPSDQWASLGGGVSQTESKLPTNPPPSYGSIFAQPSSTVSPSQPFQVNWPGTNSNDSFFGSPASSQGANNFAYFSTQQFSAPSVQPQPQTFGNQPAQNDLSSINFSSPPTPSQQFNFASSTDLNQLINMSNYTSQPVGNMASPKGIPQVNQSDYLASIQSQLASISVAKPN